MWADVEDRVNDQRVLGASSDGGDELGDGGEVAAGEDVASNKVVGFIVCFVALEKKVLELVASWLVMEIMMSLRLRES